MKNSLNLPNNLPVQGNFSEEFGSSQLTTEKVSSNLPLLASIKEIFVAMSRAETDMLIVDPIYEGCTEKSKRGRAAMYAWLQKLGLVDVVIPA